LAFSNENGTASRHRTFVNPVEMRCFQVAVPLSAYHRSLALDSQGLQQFGVNHPGDWQSLRRPEPPNCLAAARANFSRRLFHAWGKLRLIRLSTSRRRSVPLNTITPTNIHIVIIVLINARGYVFRGSAMDIPDFRQLLLRNVCRPAKFPLVSRNGLPRRRLCLQG